MGHYEATDTAGFKLTCAKMFLTKSYLQAQVS